MEAGESVISQRDVKGESERRVKTGRCFHGGKLLSEGKSLCNLRSDGQKSKSRRERVNLMAVGGTPSSVSRRIFLMAIVSFVSRFKAYLRS